MDQVKITPNFDGKLLNGPKRGPGRPVKPKSEIVASHEPTTEGQWTPPPFVAALPIEPIAPAAEPAPLKIALVGTAPSSRHLAPFNDPSWQIWACSPGNMNAVPRADIWFELHSNLLWPENQHYGAPYLEWLKQQKFKIYMQDNGLVPNATPLPKDKLVARWGKYFFTSTFAWMIAMAIEEGAKEIALFGIDMASKDEYILQRSGGQYFLQEAAKLGIRVAIPHESDLAQPPGLYGYDCSTPFTRKLLARKKEVSDRIAHMTAERDKLSHQITYLQGAVEDLDYWSTIWGGVQT